MNEREIGRSGAVVGAGRSASGGTSAERHAALADRFRGVMLGLLEGCENRCKPLNARLWNADLGQPETPDDLHDHVPGLQTELRLSNGLPEYGVFGGARSVRGVRVTYSIRFTGNDGFFHMRPSQFTVNPPRARVDGRTREVVFTYDVRPPPDAAAVRSQFDRDLFEFRRWLEWVAADVAAFNAGLPQRISEAVSRRRDELKQLQEFSAQLGVPSIATK